MDFEQTMVAIRPRTPWEAVDLGFRMVRERWRAVYGAWALAAAPVWLVTLLALHEWPWAAFLVLWWVKPLFDGAPLFVLSRAVFGADPTAAETARALPGLLRGHLLPGLVLHRLDRARSFHLPVSQLEGLRGLRRRQRVEVLNRQVLDVARGLTFICLVMEVCFVYGVLGLLALFAPLHDLSEVIDLAFGAFDGGGPAALALMGLALFVAHGLVEPCYVAAGFSLYLSRRTHLEGWDVELGFRRLAKRLGGGMGAVALLLLLASGGAFGQQLPSSAEAPPEGGESSMADLVEADVAILEVLEEPEFQSRETVTTWRLRDWVRRLPFPAVRGPEGSFGLRALVLPLEVTLGVVLALWLIWKAVRYLPSVPWTAPARQAEAAALPDAISGHDDGAPPLPADISAAASALWRQGRAVAALGLLYRGAVARIAARGRFRVHESWTEADCVAQAIEHLPPAAADYFRELTRAWVAAAYAHRAPDASRTETLLASWNRHFGGRP